MKGKNAQYIFAVCTEQMPYHTLPQTENMHIRSVGMF